MLLIAARCTSIVWKEKIIVDDRPIRFASLYSGCGGLDSGFHDAGMELADGSEGVEVVVRLRKLRPDMVVIFVTATTQQDKLDRIEASNPDRVLNKPIDVAKLRTALAQTAS